jgi:hypothetical protein
MDPLHATIEEFVADVLHPRRMPLPALSRVIRLRPISYLSRIHWASPSRSYQRDYDVRSAVAHCTRSSRGDWRMCWVSHKGEGADLAMTSHSDDLEQALQENLKLRGELAVEVAKSKDISRQRVSRDFHRLGLIFAVISPRGPTA